MARKFAKLTSKAERALPPGKAITENGITFERHTNGDGAYSVNVMVDGNRIHRVMGRVSEGTTRKDAEDYIVDVRSQARRGRLNLPAGRKLALTIAGAVPRYLERLEREGGRDIARKKQQLERSIVPFLGKRPVAQLTSSDIDQYKQHRRAQPVRSRRELRPGETAKFNSPATVNRELAALSHLVNKAVEWGWAVRPAARFRKLPESNGRIEYLTIEAAAALLTAARSDENPQIYPFILIGLRTAMRKSEILAIRREHVCLEARTIYVPHAKAGPRVQPMTADLQAFFEEYMTRLPDECPWLFPSETARCGHTTSVRKAFMRAVLAAGLDPRKVVRHTLRHTAITHLVQGGVDLPTVKRISGHKTMLMVERYAHQSAPHIAGAMDRLDQIYRGGSAEAVGPGAKSTV